MPEVVDGGPGYDQISFRGLPRSVSANIETGTASWRGGGLAFADVHNLIGSRRSDELVGSSETDYLFGRGGQDMVRGQGGDDAIVGGKGADTTDGGTGYDFCSGEHLVGCEAKLA